MIGLRPCTACNATGLDAKDRYGVCVRCAATGYTLPTPEDDRHARALLARHNGRAALRRLHGVAA